MTFPRTGWWVANIFLVIATATAVALGLWQFDQKNRIPPPVDEQLVVRQELIAAASSNMETFQTIRAETAEQDVAAAAAVTTGRFGADFRAGSAQLAADYKMEHISATAVVHQAGVVSIDGDTGVALVFVSQTTTLDGQPSPLTINQAVEVGLRKVNGVWLIERADGK